MYFSLTTTHLLSHFTYTLNKRTAYNHTYIIGYTIYNIQYTMYLYNLHVDVHPATYIHIVDKPGSPGAPIVDEVGGDFVNLSWDKANDGGGRLLGYIIEKREASVDRWTRVNYQPIKTLSYNVVNLIEENSYYFRVIAANMAGEGKPSDESAKIVVKDPKGTMINLYLSFSS